MPYVRIVKYDDNEFSISDCFRGDVARAVELDHPCSDDNTCDIAAALGNGWPFVAAFLLSGATDTPVLDAVLRAHAWNGTATGGFRAEEFNAHSGPGTAPEGWNEWCRWHRENTAECECGSFVFLPADYCGNCLKAIPTNEGGEP